jgi:hypothetical protein
MLPHLKRQRAAQAAGFVAATIAAVALTGWWAGQPVLARGGSEYSLITPPAALCFAALGLALIHPGTNSRFAFVIGLVMAALTAADLGHDLAGWCRGPHLSRPKAGSFRMTTTLALSLALAGSSLALGRFERHPLAASDQRRRRRH